jgi:hypothetical protein
MHDIDSLTGYFAMIVIPWASKWITLDLPLIQMHLDILPNTGVAAAQWVFVMPTKEFLSVMFDILLQ